MGPPIKSRSATYLVPSCIPFFIPERVVGSARACSWSASIKAARIQAMIWTQLRRGTLSSGRSCTPAAYVMIGSEAIRKGMPQDSAAGRNGRLTLLIGRGGNSVDWLQPCVPNYRNGRHTLNNCQPYESRIRKRRVRCGSTVGRITCLRHARFRDDRFRRKCIAASNTERVYWPTCHKLSLHVCLRRLAVILRQIRSPIIHPDNIFRSPDQDDHTLVPSSSRKMLGR
jgi:hypothetical protein